MILLPEHSTIYSDPRFVAVAWSVDASNTTTAQVLGCQRRCLPFLARYEVFDQLCSDRALRTVDGGLWAEGLAVTPEHYFGLWRAALGRPLSAAQFARQFGVYAAAVFDAPLAPLRGQASSWSSSPFERFDDIESRYAARMRYRNDTQAFELVLDLREPDAARDAFYLESFVLAAGLGEAATIEVPAEADRTSRSLAARAAAAVRGGRPMSYRLEYKWGAFLVPAASHPRAHWPRGAR